MNLFIIIVLVILLFYGLRMHKYNKSKYKEESGNSFFSVMMDKGKYGEYLSFNWLEKISGEHKILTNVYLPKGNGETTEVDLIYIHETGIYVLEPKNYSGWIFGDEKSKYWMQILQNKHKEKFYNPIWQNNTHIKYLIKLLNENEEKIKPYFIFSNSELEELIKKKPKTITELKLIHGFGKLKCNKYGEDITKIVKEYCVY